MHVLVFCLVLLILNISAALLFANANKSCTFVMLHNNIETKSLYYYSFLPIKPLKQQRLNEPRDL